MGLVWKKISECGVPSQRVHGWARYKLVRSRPSKSRRADGRPDFVEVCMADVLDCVANPPKTGPKPKA